MVMDGLSPWKGAPSGEMMDYSLLQDYCEGKEFRSLDSWQALSKHEVILNILNDLEDPSCVWGALRLCSVPPDRLCRADSCHFTSRRQIERRKEQLRLS